MGTYEGWIYGWEHDVESQDGLSNVDKNEELESTELSKFIPKSGPRLDDNGMSLVFAVEAHVGVVRCAALMEEKRRRYIGNWRRGRINTFIQLKKAQRSRGASATYRRDIFSEVCGKAAPSEC